jgi:hypothetical protein
MMAGKRGAPPKITEAQWTDARAMRESGSSFREVADGTGIDPSLLCRTAKNQGWGDGADVGEAIRKRVDEKVHGIVYSVDPAKKAAALDAAAEKVVAKVEQHKTEWDAPRKNAYDAFESDDPAKMRMAKAFAETLKIIQDGERRAWGIDSAIAPKPAPIETTVKIKAETNVTSVLPDTAAELLQEYRRIMEAPERA